MKIKWYSFLNLLFLVFSAQAQDFELSSPNKKISIAININEQISFSAAFDGQPIIAPSSIGVNLMDKSPSTAAIKALFSPRRTHNEVAVPQVKQKSATIKDHYNEIQLELSNNFTLIFRAFDEGIAYRFAYTGKESAIVQSEDLFLQLAADDNIYFPEEVSLFSHNERNYIQYNASAISSDQLASLPLLIDSKAGPKILLTETDLINYPGMWINGTGQRALKATHPRYPLEEKQEGDRNVKVTKTADYIAKINANQKLPWRILAIAENDGDLLTNQMVYLLSSPSKIEDASWIKPGKVAWDWYNANNIFGVDFEAGINTETYKYYIDFAAKYGIDYIILDEGWTKPEDIMAINPEIDIEELFAYAKNKNVGIVLWVLFNSLDNKLEEALNQYEKWGAKGVKVDFMQRDDQLMVNYYHKIAEAAAKRKLLVDFHGSYKPAGLHRTWPNVITREGVYGLEQNKWDKEMKIDPEHNVTIPFIRMVAGPMDYTPGAMVNAQKDNFAAVFDRPMSLGTRCHQLSMYVIYESPLQMLADSPSQYLREAACMEFLSVVPTVWESTKVLDAKVGDYILMAREAENGDWYLGAMTDWTARKLTVDFSFLPVGKYEIQIYKDGKNAARYASDYKKEVMTISSGDKRTIELAPGGGWVASAKLIK